MISRTHPMPPGTGAFSSTCGQRGRGHSNLHLRQDIHQDLLQKTRSEEPRARGTSPRATVATTRRLGRQGTKKMGTGPSGSSSISDRQPQGQQQQLQQQLDLDHRRAIEKLNLELEEAQTNANMSYASVVKGTPPPPLPPPRPDLHPQQQPLPQGDLEQRQTFESLFTLYDS
jgi:hypothetical protein